MTELPAFGRRVTTRGLVVYGFLSEESWRRFLYDAAVVMGMQPVGEAAVWTYPLTGGEGGTGQTIVQPITESFLTVDTWPDHGAAYLFIVSCKPFARNCLDELLARFRLKPGAGFHQPLEIQ